MPRGNPAGSAPLRGRLHRKARQTCSALRGAAQEPEHIPHMGGFRVPPDAGSRARSKIMNRFLRVLSSAGRARPLQGLGREFESLSTHPFVRFEKLVRLPILGRGNKKVIAVLSNFYDLTHRLTLNKLFQFYRDYYPEKQAIQQLLKHLKIDHYFSELPTLSEVWLLFALHQDPRQKGAARLLGLSHKTVYVYVTHLRDKLRVPDLHTVLAQLRAVPIRPDHIRL